MALIGGKEMREDDEHVRNFVEVDTEVSINLEASHKEKWQSLVNNRYHGTSQIPLDVQVSQECKDAHWYINCGKRVPIKVRLYDDGSYEVVAQSYFRQAHPL